MNEFSSSRKKSRSLYKIQTFTKNDTGQVAEMAKSYFPEKVSADLYQLKSMLISGLSESNKSLVCVSPDGTIHGYLAVKLVDFRFKGKPITGAIFSDFMVNEEARAVLIPMRMLQTALKGEQDFSFSDDAVHASRLLWCRLGGQIAYPYSTYYTAPLRPASFSFQVIGKKMSPFIRRFFGAVARSADSFFKILRVPFFQVITNNGLFARELTGHQLYEGLSSLVSNYELHPIVSSGRMDKFLSSLKREKQYGELERVALYDNEEKIAGWFIYYRNENGRCNIVHSECLPGKEEALYSSLKFDAFSKGGINFSGRLSPALMGSSFSEKTFTRPGGKWALIHSHNSELINSIQSGKAFLTRCW
ncbi:MAG: hypothetical protein WD016_10165 [Balneolaceae bacterium]